LLGLAPQGPRRVLAGTRHGGRQGRSPGPRPRGAGHAADGLQGFRPMTKSGWIALGLVLSLMGSVQHYRLEEQPETQAEARMKRVADLPASDVLPTYLASLFFGAFRAMAVDILWIQLRKVEEEKRWYERREIVKLISYVQPRNPEVWSHLGWHSAYNVANGFT